MSETSAIAMYLYSKVVVMAGALVLALLRLYPSIDKYFGLRYPRLSAAVTFAVLAAWAYVAMRRTTYLPFLGETLLPATVLQPINVAKLQLKDSKAKSVKLDIKAPRARYVVWWASEPGDEIEMANVAYNKYRNAGISAVKDGRAKVELLCPAKYVVGGRMRKMLDRHVHYREVYWNGFMSDVRTQEVVC